MCGEGAGQSTIPIQVKIYCLKMIKTVLTLIYAQLFCCLVSHNKYSDIYFGKKKTALNSFSYRFFYRIVKKCLPQIKISDQNV